MDVPLVWVRLVVEHSEVDRNFLKRVHIVIQAVVIKGVGLEIVVPVQVVRLQVDSL